MKRSLVPGLLFAMLLSTACNTVRSSDKEVNRETRDKRKLPLVLSAGTNTTYFNLRQEQFFELFGQIEGRTDYYAGIYERKGDSLLLSFHNNYQPADLTGKGLIRDAQVTLFSKTGQHLRLPVK